MGCSNVWGFWCCGFVALVFVFLVYMIDLGFIFLYDFLYVFVCFCMFFVLGGFQKIEMEKK